MMAGGFRRWCSGNAVCMSVSLVCPQYVVVMFSNCPNLEKGVRINSWTYEILQGPTMQLRVFVFWLLRLQNLSMLKCKATQYSPR